MAAGATRDFTTDSRPIARCNATRSEWRPIVSRRRYRDLNTTVAPASAMAIRNNSRAIGASGTICARRALAVDGDFPGGAVGVVELGKFAPLRSRQFARSLAGQYERHQRQDRRAVHRKFRVSVQRA